MTDEKADCCEGCGENADEDGATFDFAVEALETFDELLCDSCFDNRRESAWIDQEEAKMAGDGPLSMDEQHRRAWAEKQESRR